MLQAHSKLKGRLCKHKTGHFSFFSQVSSKESFRDTQAGRASLYPNSDINAMEKQRLSGALLSFS
jgi:hypothetical protein